VTNLAVVNRCGCCQLKRLLSTEAALPPDVRRGSAPPFKLEFAFGLGPRLGLCPFSLGQRPNVGLSPTLS
jgi:hypothetical protein